MSELMRSILQRIATGPELSKDISREEARAGMRLVLEQRRGSVGKQGLVAAHASAAPARHDEAGHARRLNPHVTSNSATSVPSAMRPVERAT